MKDFIADDFNPFNKNRRRISKNKLTCKCQCTIHTEGHSRQETYNNGQVALVACLHWQLQMGLGYLLLGDV